MLPNTRAFGCLSCQVAWMIDLHLQQKRAIRLNQGVTTWCKKPCSRDFMRFHTVCVWIMGSPAIGMMLRHTLGSTCKTARFDMTNFMIDGMDGWNKSKPNVCLIAYSDPIRWQERIHDDLLYCGTCQKCWKGGFPNTTAAGCIRWSSFISPYISSKVFRNMGLKESKGSIHRIDVFQGFLNS